MLLFRAFRCPSKALSQIPATQKTIGRKNNCAQKGLLRDSRVSFFFFLRVLHLARFLPNFGLAIRQRNSTTINKQAAAELASPPLFRFARACKCRSRAAFFVAQRSSKVALALRLNSIRLNFSQLTARRSTHLQMESNNSLVDSATNAALQTAFAGH